MEDIAHTLQASLSTDASTRIAAEVRLSKAFSQPETGLMLALLIVAQAVDPTIRQAAGVVLRKYVTEHWSPYFAQFRGSAPSAEIKDQIRHVVFQGLSDPSRKIRTTAAYIISTIAHSDWPDEFPDLLTKLVSALSVSPDAVHGSLQVFTEFMKNDLTEDQLMPVLRQLMPALLQILGQPQVHSAVTRARTIIVFRQCVVSLIMLKEQYPDATKEASSTVLPVWLDAFSVLLASDPRVDVADSSTWDALAVKIQIFKSLNTIIGSYAKTLEPHLGSFIDAAAQHLAALAPAYAAYYLAADAPSAPVSDEDPDGISLPALVAPLLDFLSNLVRRGRMTEWLAQPERVQALVASIVSWAQITGEEEGKWEDSPNTFVAEDDDDSNADNLRAAAFELISHLVEKVPEPTVSALNVATVTIVADSNAQKQAGNPIWWKHLEALLAVLSAASDDLFDYKDKFDFGRLFNEVIPALLSLQDSPFLSGRAFVFASRLTQALPVNLAQQYLTAAADVLEGSGGVVIKISAVKAIRNFCDKIQDPSVVALAPRLVKNLGPFLAASEDTLSLVIETLVTVLSLKQTGWLSSDLATMLTTALLDVWEKNVKDPILLSVLEDAFEALAKAQYRATITVALPRLCATLVQAQASQSWVASSSTQIITALFRGAPSEGGIGDGVFLQLAPALFGVLERIDDRDVLQNGIVCLTLIIRKDTPQVLAYPDGLALVLRLIARTLAPVDSESGGLFVGDLILSLLRRANTALLPNMQELLNALLARMPSAKTPTFIQSLILPFAYLIYTQRDAALELLENTQTPDGRGGLQVLLEVWSENAETFIGFKATRLSNLALSTMFASERPSLQNINVKGDLIVKPETSNVIMTRSKAKQIPHEFSVVPFPLKALKLLLHDLQSGGDAAVISAAGGADLVDSDEDEQWSDEEKIGEEAWLSDLLGPGAKGFEDDDVVQDSGDDFQDDPISNIDMKAHLITFLKECASRNTNNFSALVEQLKVEETVVLRAAVQS